MTSRTAGDPYGNQGARTRRAVSSAAPPNSRSCRSGLPAQPFGNFGGCNNTEPPAAEYAYSYTSANALILDWMPLLVVVPRYPARHARQRPRISYRVRTCMDSHEILSASRSCRQGSASQGHGALFFYPLHPLQPTCRLLTWGESLSLSLLRRTRRERRREKVSQIGCRTRAQPSITRYLSTLIGMYFFYTPPPLKKAPVAAPRIARRIGMLQCK